MRKQEINSIYGKSSSAITTDQTKPTITPAFITVGTGTGPSIAPPNSYGLPTFGPPTQNIRDQMLNELKAIHELLEEINEKIPYEFNTLK